MSTPAAIAVYTSGTGAPALVSERPWRGVYHHWDGDPGALGQHLLDRVARRRGDLAAVVRELIDEAPAGWSRCFATPEGTESEAGLFARIASWLGNEPDEAPGVRLADDDAGLPVSPEDTDNVAFVYVFDLDARRLDAFATHVEGRGERIGSVSFSAKGAAEPRALDLLPEERVEEEPMPGRELSADDLLTILRKLPPLMLGGAELTWVRVERGAAGSLAVVFRVFEVEDDGASSIVEQVWRAVPAAARREPRRVENHFWALLHVLYQGPHRIDPFWIASLDVLRRSGARDMATFVEIFRAHAARAGLEKVPELEAVDVSGS